MCTYLKNMEGYKLNDLKLKEFDSIQEMFDKAFKRVNTFEDFRTELVEGKEKIAGTELIQENAKKQKLVKAKYKSTRPVEDLDLLLWGDLKTIFEPHVEDKIWRNQQDYKMLDWKLYDSCRVHSLRMQHMQIYMLVEKKYPLAPLTLSMMLEKKLMIDYENYSVEVNAASENMLEVTTASEYLVNAASFDALVIKLPRCTCHAAEDFKKHNQLMKLMQFLMGLDDCYMQIKSNILSRDELSYVRCVYAIISSEKSHRVVSSFGVGTSQRSQSSVFSSNVGNRSNAQRPQTSINNFRPSNVTRPMNSGNRRPNGGSLLVCENYGFNGIKVSYPNGTEALITKVGNLNLTKFLTLYDVLVVPEYSVTLVSVYKVARNSRQVIWTCTIYDNVERLPSSVLKGKSPYELVFNKKPSLKHLRVFGCLCFATILNNHDKFSSRAEKRVLLFMRALTHPMNAHDHSDGSHSSQPSSPIIDHYESDFGHSQSSNSSASENERAATSDHNTTLSEDDIAVDDTTEHVHVLNNQPLRRSERAFVFPNKYNEYVVDSESEKGNFLALLVYVDDNIVTGNNVDEIEKFKQFLRTKFQIKDLEKVLELLSEYGLLACKPSATPLEQNLAISNEPTEVDKSDSDSDCDLPSCDDFSPINIYEEKSVTFSNPLFDSNDDFTSSDDESLSDELVTPLSKLNEDECFDPGGDFVLEEIKACLTSDSIPPGIDDDDFDPEGDILLLEKLLNDDPSSPLPPKELNFEELKVIKSDVSKDFEDDYYDSEGDIIYLESLIIKDTIPNLPPEVFLDHDPKNLKDEPDNEDLKSMVKVFDPGIHEKTFSPTYVKLPFEDRYYLSLTYVIRIFLPYFTYPVESSLPLSSGSEDIIFDPGISAYRFYFLEPMAYEKMCSSTCFILNITMIWGESS
ncbi:ribonuclease H-like domain-containing protein [Tanacetum coccineum]